MPWITSYDHLPLSAPNLFLPTFHHNFAAWQSIDGCRIFMSYRFSAILIMPHNMALYGWVGWNTETVARSSIPHPNWPCQLASQKKSARTLRKHRTHFVQRNYVESRPESWANYRRIFRKLRECFAMLQASPSTTTLCHSCPTSVAQEPTAKHTLSKGTKTTNKRLDGMSVLFCRHSWAEMS